MTEMMMRDCDSLNNTVAASLCKASVGLVSSRTRRPQGDGYSRSRSKQLFGIETRFGECDGKSAFGAIVRALHETFTNQITNGILHFDFMCEIDVRWRTDF